MATGGSDDAARLRAAITVNPNPVAGDQLHVRYRGKAKRLTVEIRDGRGLVLIKGLQLTGGTAFFIGSLRPGAYYLIASDPQRGLQASLPFVKL